MDGNPMLVVYLDGAVSHFQQLAGGDSAYLKGVFSKYLGNGAKIEPVTITYKGQQVDGYRVTATPYANDPARAKMNGFEDATFTISLSAKIPRLLCADGFPVHEYRQERVRQLKRRRRLMAWEM